MIEWWQLAVADSTVCGATRWTRLRCARIVSTFTVDCSAARAKCRKIRPRSPCSTDRPFTPSSSRTSSPSTTRSHSSWPVFNCRPLWAIPRKVPPTLVIPSQLSSLMSRAVSSWIIIINIIIIIIKKKKLNKIK